MNPPRYWVLLDDACSAIEISAKTPGFFHSYGAIIFIAAISIGFHIATQKTRRLSMSRTHGVSIFIDYCTAAAIQRKVEGQERDIGLINRTRSTAV
jgi:hypothetical protein